MERQFSCGEIDIENACFLESCASSSYKKSKNEKLNLSKEKKANKWYDEELFVKRIPKQL